MRSTLLFSKLVDHFFESINEYYHKKFCFFAFHLEISSFYGTGITIILKIHLTSILFNLFVRFIGRSLSSIIFSFFLVFLLLIFLDWYITISTFGTGIYLLYILLVYIGTRKIIMFNFII